MHFPKQKDTKSRFAGRNLLQSLAPNLSAQVGTDTRIMLWQISCPPIIRRIIEGFIQKRRQRSLLPCGGQNLFNYLPRQQFCTRKNLKNRTTSSFSSYHPGAIHPFLHIIPVQFILFISSGFKIASTARNSSISVPQEAATTFAFSSV